MSASKTELHENLPLFLDDRLSPADRADFKVHLAVCAVCQGALAQFSQLRADLKNLPAPVPSPAFYAKVLVAARARQEEQFVPRRPWILVFSAIAAVAMIGLVVVSTHEFWPPNQRFAHDFVTVDVREHVRSKPVATMFQPKSEVGSLASSGPQLQPKNFSGIRAKDLPIAIGQSSQLAGTGGTGGGLVGRAMLGYPGQTNGRNELVSGVPSAATAVDAQLAQGKAGHAFEIAGPLNNRPIVKKVIPQYPTWAQEQGIIGSVRVWFTITQDGVVSPSMRVTKTTGYPDLDRLALEALNQWRFAPLSTADESSQWGIITFQFELKN